LIVGSGTTKSVEFLGKICIAERVLCPEVFPGF
jgi:hypothetical protein